MDRTAAILDPADPASPLAVPAAQTAVLLLDYQQMLLPRLPDEAERAAVVAGARRLREWGLSAGALVVHGLIDAAGPTFAPFKSAARVAPMVEAARKDPELAREPPELRAGTGAGAAAEAEAEVTLYRTLGQFGGLKLRGLPELLHRRGIRSLLIGGISTSGCVLRTASAAADEGFVVAVVREACADPDPALHAAVLDRILLPNVHVVRLAEWTRAWEEEEEEEEEGRAS